MSLLIRTAPATEAPLLQSLVQPVPGAALPVVTSDYVARHTVCSAWEGPEVVGFFALEERAGVWWLAHLWVAEAARRRGRGRWLMTEAVRRARRLAADSLRLAPEPAAASFFRRLGARPVAAAPAEMEIDLATWLEPLPDSVSELGWSE